VGTISRLPVSLRILLESVLRNLDGRRIRELFVLRRQTETTARTNSCRFGNAVDRRRI
jgi:aconitase A